MKMMRKHKKEHGRIIIFSLSVGAMQASSNRALFSSSLLDKLSC
jgi:hypothetical protein